MLSKLYSILYVDFNLKITIKICEKNTREDTDYISLNQSHYPPASVTFVVALAGG